MSTLGINEEAARPVGRPSGAQNSPGLASGRTKSDASEWIAFLRSKLDELTDLENRTKVQTFINHLQAEASHDVTAAIATMTPDGCSHNWGGGIRVGGDRRPIPNRRRAALYSAAVRALTAPFEHIELETHRFHVGVDGLAMDGTLWNTVPGTDLGLWGVDLPDDVTPERWFIIGTRVALFMSFEDGLIIGEDMYWDEHVTAYVLDESA